VVPPFYARRMCHYSLFLCFTFPRTLPRLDVFALTCQRCAKEGFGPDVVFRVWLTIPSQVQRSQISTRSISSLAKHLRRSLNVSDFPMNVSFYQSFTPSFQKFVPGSLKANAPLVPLKIFAFQFFFECFGEGWVWLRNPKILGNPTSRVSGSCCFYSGLSHKLIPSERAAFCRLICPRTLSPAFKRLFIEHLVPALPFTPPFCGDISICRV